MIINNAKRDILINRYKKLKYFNNDIKIKDTIKAKHRSCTDSFNIFLDIKNNHITGGMFNGDGCIISTVAIDLIIESCIGLDIKKILLNLENYENMIKGNIYKKDNINKSLLLFDNISKYPNRIICASLGSSNIINYLK